MMAALENAGSILALDLGTNTGWALSQSDRSLLSGSWGLKPGRFDGGGMRYVHFRRNLSDIYAACGLDYVVFEEVRRHAGTDAAHVYGGLMAVLTAWCEELSLPYEGVPVGTWKKALTGKGNAHKGMVRIAVETMGYEPENYDEADAIGILLWARGML